MIRLLGRGSSQFGFYGLSQIPDFTRTSFWLFWYRKNCGKLPEILTEVRDVLCIEPNRERIMMIGVEENMSIMTEGVGKYHWYA